MSRTSNNQEAPDGQKLLSAIEHIIAPDEEIIRQVENIRQANTVKDQEDDSAYLERLAGKIISFYSIKSAISGGATAIPAVIPGAGTLVSLIGGALADVVFILKFEVEMALALATLYNFDIRQNEDRQLAYLLASISTYEAKSGKNFFIDLAKTEETAIWNYAPREVSKYLLTVLTQLGLLSISKNTIKALPLLGITVGAGMNKILTAKVGHRCQYELARRWTIQRGIKEEIIDATFEEVENS